MRAPKGWKVLERLAGGQQGVVYRATNALTGNTVALKHLAKVKRGDELVFEAEGARERFIREATLGARLLHTHVVKYGEAFEDDAGVWLPMELIQGETWRALLAKRPGGLPAPRVVALLSEAAAGLAYLHGQGLAHRDVKPENLMITHQPGAGSVGDRAVEARGARERVKVIDLGVALGGEVERLTDVGSAVPGTLLYQAPEALEEAAGESGVPIALEQARRGDVWALGLVGLELLWQHPYAELRSIAEVVQGILAGRGRPREVARALADRPEWLKELLATMLEPDGSKRPKMSEVAAKLGAVRAVGELGSEATGGAPERAPIVPIPPITPIPPIGSTYVPPPIDLEGGGEGWWGRLRGWLPVKGRRSEPPPADAPPARALPPGAPPAAPGVGGEPGGGRGESPPIAGGEEVAVAPEGGGLAGAEGAWADKLRVVCTSCKRRLLLASKWHGRAGKLRCPSCGHTRALFTPGLLPSMVVLPAGWFQMGSTGPESYPDESYAAADGSRRCVEVTLTRSFELGRTPVTQAEWSGVFANRSSHRGDRRPVENVRWYDAVAYCNALSAKHGLEPAYELGSSSVGPTEAGYAPAVKYLGPDRNGFRLPTEAEWEYACRAGSVAERYGPLDEVAWHSGNSSHSTHDVAEKAANSWGLFDMLGNVWAWTQGTYQAYAVARETDPLVETSGSRVIRGGSFCDDARYVRAAPRGRYAPSDRHGGVGFRLARSVP